VHDGIHVEKAGIPAVTICTDIFVETSRAMASMWGAPEYPMVFTAHPINHLTREQLRGRAEDMLDRIVAILTGGETISQATNG
jgi:hypothetical protein